MNVLQRQMFRRGGPTSPMDIIIAERQKRGLPIRQGIFFTRELINQVRQLQGGQSIAEIFGEVQQSAPAPDITIQEQPQQAPSESLNVEPVLESAVPSADPRKLIEYYLSQGYNPADILEIFPAATTQMIEEVAQQKGGAINPGVRGPETFKGGPENVFIDETVLVEGGQPITEPPIDAISEELIKLEIPKPAPTGEIDLQDPDLVDLETAVVEGQVTGQTNLGPNEYKASDGTITKIDPDRFAEILNLENTFELQALIQNPEVEYGSNLQEIIRDTVGRRAAPFASVSPSRLKFGELLPDYLNVQTGFRDIGGQGLDFLLEALEGTTNVGRRLISGFTGERQDDQGDIDFFQSERYPMGEDALIGGFETGFAPDESGYLRMGISAADLDALVNRASTGARTEQQEQDQIDTQKEIDNLQQTSAQDSTEVVTAEEAVTETPEAESPAEGEAVAEAATTETGADAVGAAGVKTAEQARAEDPLISGNPFTSKEFINFARGLSKGLAQEEEFGKGLATGAALAAEQRGVDDLESQKLDTELKIELAKLQDKGDLKLSEAKSVYDLNNTANTSAQSFQNSTATVALIKELENILKNENPTAISGFASRILERAAVALNSDVTKDKEDFKKLSATERAKKLSTLISQANIREILGESGRTISNFDRQIVEQLSTSIDLGAPAASNLVALANVESRIKNNMQTQLDEIRSARQALNLAGFDLIGENALKTIEFGFGLLDDSGVVFEEDDVLLDYRNEFSKLLD